MMSHDVYTKHDSPVVVVPKEVYEEMRKALKAKLEVNCSCDSCKLGRKVLADSEVE